MKLCVGDVSCLFQNAGIWGCGKVQLVCIFRLLGMDDSLLMHLCGKLLEVGHRQRGVGSVVRLLLLAYLDGCLTIC